MGQDQQKACIILNGNLICLSRLSATFASEYAGFVPREWKPAKAYCPEQIEIAVSKTEIAVTLLGHHTNEILYISDWHGIQNPSSTDNGWNPVPGIRNL